MNEAQRASSGGTRNVFNWDKKIIIQIWQAVVGPEISLTGIRKLQIYYQICKIKEEEKERYIWKDVKLTTIFLWKC